MNKEYRKKNRMKKEKRKIFMWNIEMIMIKNYNYLDICFK